MWSARRSRQSSTRRTKTNVRVGTTVSNVHRAEREVLAQESTSQKSTSQNIEEEPLRPSEEVDEFAQAFGLRCMNGYVEEGAMDELTFVAPVGLGACVRAFDQLERDCRGQHGRESAGIRAPWKLVERQGAVFEVPGAMARATSTEPTPRPSLVAGLGTTPFIGDRVGDAMPQAVLATINEEVTVAMREGCGGYGVRRVSAEQ